jgi:hypothetical protein
MQQPKPVSWRSLRSSGLGTSRGVISSARKLDIGRALSTALVELPPALPAGSSHQPRLGADPHLVARGTQHSDFDTLAGGCRNDDGFAYSAGEYERANLLLPDDGTNTVPGPSGGVCKPFLKMLYEFPYV